MKLIELRIDFPLRCSIRCYNEPEAIRAAEKELVHHAWWLFNERRGKAALEVAEGKCQEK